MLKKISTWVMVLIMMFVTTSVFAEVVTEGGEAQCLFAACKKTDGIAKETKAAAINFPNVAVPDVATQIKMYREAYAPYNHEGFDPESAHVAELGKMLEIGFSYANSYLSEGEYKQLLQQFWQEVCEDMEAQKMTIQRFKAHNLRLANLLTKGLGLVNNYLQTVVDEKYAVIQSSDQWKELEVYIKQDDMKVLPWPFCFEAVLYHPKGVIELMDYVNEYLKEDLMLGISAMPIDGKGPHDNLVYDPFSFLVHDFGHWRQFVDMMEGKSENLELMRRLLMCVYDSVGQVDPKDQVAVFLLLHEITRSMDYVKMRTPSEELVDEEKLPYSERLMFKRCTIGASIDDYEQDDEEDEAQEWLEQLEDKMDWINLDYISSIEGEESKVRFRITLKKKCQDGFAASCHTYGATVAEGEAQIESIPFTEIRGVSTLRLKNIILELKMDETALRSECENFGLENCAEVSFDAIRLKLENVETKGLDKAAIFRIIYHDIANVLRDVMGAGVVPSEMFTRKQVSVAQNQFFLEFYEKHKHLYSDAEIVDTDAVKNSTTTE